VKKIILGGLAAAAMAAPIAAVASPASAAQPTTTTHNVTLNAADDVVVDLPALNSQFTTMQITVNGKAYWGEGLYTEYGADNATSTNRELLSGIWNNGGDHDGPMLAEGVQAGAVIYRVDGHAWQKVTGASITVSEGTHVQVAYNERPESYADNSGSLSLKVVRAKG
jgi:hypothetical protein